MVGLKTNDGRIKKKHQNNTNSFNNSRPIQYDVSINDKDNENVVWKPSSTKQARKHVYIMKDSIVRYVNGYNTKSLLRRIKDTSAEILSLKISLNVKKILIIKGFGKRLPHFFWIKFYQPKK